MAKGSEPTRLVKLGAAVFLFLPMLLYGSIVGGRHQTRRIEQSFAPTIEALDKFHEDRHRFPEGLEELVPKYISAVPACGTAPAAYSVQHAPVEGFKITCLEVIQQPA